MPQFHINLETSNLSICQKMVRVSNFQWHNGVEGVCGEGVEGVGRARVSWLGD